MPTFTPPIFNLSFNCWYGGNRPDLGDPNVEDGRCQKYCQWSSAPGTLYFDSYDGSTPLQFIRFAKGQAPFTDNMFGETSWFDWLANAPYYIECPAGSNQYYAVVWVDVAHQSFPNQYTWATVKAVKENGDPVFWGPSIPP